MLCLCVFYIFFLSSFRHLITSYLFILVPSVFACSSLSLHHHHRHFILCVPRLVNVNITFRIMYIACTRSPLPRPIVWCSCYYCCWCCCRCHCHCVVVELPYRDVQRTPPISFSHSLSLPHARPLRLNSLSTNKRWKCENVESKTKN